MKEEALIDIGRSSKSKVSYGTSIVLYSVLRPKVRDCRSLGGTSGFPTNFISCAASKHQHCPY